MKKQDIKLITVKETDKEHRHERVILNGVYIGYIIKNDSNFANIDENWNFCGISGHPSFYAKTKKELIEDIS